MSFALEKSQHINVSNPMMEETIMSQQEEITMITSSTKKICPHLLAPMQHKDGIGSCIHGWYGLISLANSQTTNATVYYHYRTLLSCEVSMWLQVP